MDAVRGPNEGKEKARGRGPEESPGDRLHSGCPEDKDSVGDGVKRQGGSGEAVEATAETQVVNGAQRQELSRSQRLEKKASWISLRSLQFSPR